MYNATQSVDLKELSLLSEVTLTNPVTMLNNSSNPADKYFNFTQSLQQSQNIANTENISTDVEYQEKLIDNEINRNQSLISKIRKDNPNSQLTDQEILNLYSDFSNTGGMLIF